jgi:serine/threonine-protein kinase
MGEEAAMSIDVGEIIAGKYELVRRLGRGAMGEVWVARHLTLGENVAIKFLSVSEPAPRDDVTLQQRFLFEAQVAARLSRKTAQIVSVTDHGFDDGDAYLVMELLEGDTLQALVDRAGPRPLAEVVEIVAQAAKGLAVAHAEGVLHRDLNSANVFVARDESGRPLVKILDFGLARSMRAPRRTARGMVLGSPEYMSPEQALGLSSLDQRCDVWALSVVSYEALTGTLPFEADPPEKWLEQVQNGRYAPLAERGPDLPSALETFFGRAFSPRIDDRFKTAAGLADAFARAAMELPLPGRVEYMRPALAAPSASPTRRSPRPAQMVLAAVLVCMVVICVLAVMRSATATHPLSKPEEAATTTASSSSIPVATPPAARDPQDSSAPSASEPSTRDSRPVPRSEGRHVTPAPRGPVPAVPMVPTASFAPVRPGPSASPPAPSADRDNVF